MTIYIALYMATLFAGCLRGGRVYAAGLWLVFGASLLAWLAPNPLLWLAAAHVTAAAYFALVSECKKCTICAVLMACGALTCCGAYFTGFGTARPLPDILALLGHAANLCAFLKGDSGGRLDRILRLCGLSGRGDYHFVSVRAQVVEETR